MRVSTPPVSPPRRPPGIWPGVVVVFVVVACFQALLGEQLWGTSRGATLPRPAQPVAIHTAALSPIELAAIETEVSLRQGEELCRICDTNEVYGYGLGLDWFRQGYGTAPGKPPVVPVYDALIASCPCR